jgi:hypothetical protein
MKASRNPLASFRSNYRVEANNLFRPDISYPYISVIELFEDGSENIVWITPFSHEEKDISFCGVFDKRKFAAINEDGRIKIFDIPTRKQIYHHHFKSHSGLYATFSYNKQLLHVCIDDENRDSYILTLGLSQLEIVSSIKLPGHIHLNFLYARSDGCLLTLYHRIVWGRGENEPVEMSQIIFCSDIATGETKEYLLEKTNACITNSTLPLVNEAQDLLLLPSWKEPEIINLANGEKAFQTYILAYRLQDLKLMRTIPTFAVPEKYLSEVDSEDTDVATALMRSPKDHIYYDALEKLLHCVCRIFPAEDSDNAFWVQWSTELFRKFDFKGNPLSPFIASATDENQPIESLLLNRFPNCHPHKAVFEKDGRIILRGFWENKQETFDVSHVNNRDLEQQVLVVERFEQIPPIGKDILSDAVMADFERHRVIEVLIYDLRIKNEYLGALNELVKRTEDIEPLPIDGHLIVAIKDDLGYLNNETKFFPMARNYPESGILVRQLVENVLSYDRFSELYFDDETPVFMHGALVLAENFPEHLDTVLKYLKLATHTEGCNLKTVLIPTLIKAYRGTAEEARVLAVCEEAGFREEELPFVRILDTKINTLSNAPLWEFLDNLGGYEQPYFVLAHSTDFSLKLPDTFPEAKETDVHLFPIDNRTVFLSGEFYELKDALEYLDNLHIEVPEFRKINQITLYHHNSLGCSFNTLEAVSTLHTRAQQQLASRNWVIHNDFSDYCDSSVASEQPEYVIYRQ